LSVDKIHFASKVTPLGLIAIALVSQPVHGDLVFTLGPKINQGCPQGSEYPSQGSGKGSPLAGIILFNGMFMVCANKILLMYIHPL